MPKLKETVVKIATLKFIIINLFLVASCENNEEIFDPIDDLSVSIPDIHFETKLIAQGIDSDGIVNHRILKSDAESVSRLDLNLSSLYGNINSLKGIEAFTNITYLSAAGQNFNTIDVSKNTLLDSLYLWGNNLTTIDISNNSKLLYLDIEANQLNSIQGLSSLTHLKKLNLSFNDFEEISFQNESLEVVLISHNLLKSIDTKDAPNLKNAFLILNQLTSVDFSSNTQLETLVMSANKLENINLENNTKLTHFYASSNLFTSLDVSKNSNLIDLRVDRNPNLNCIKILDNQQILTVSISNYQSLNTSCN